MGHLLGRSLAACAALVASYLIAPADAETFTVAVIPDTQYYTVVSGGEAMFRREMQYLADQKVAQNIVFTIHLGDVWEHGDSHADVEVPIATRSMQILADAGMPFAVVPGNHDYDNAHRRTQGIPLDGNVIWAQAFGPQTAFFANKQWYLGSSSAGMNSCQIFSAGGKQFLHIGLALEPSQADLQFAREMLDAYPNLPAILTTHEYLGWDSNRAGQARRLDDCYRGEMDHTSAHELWEQLISKEPQIFMVLCGHSAWGPFACANRRSDPNLLGVPVHQLLSDYQFVATPPSTSLSMPATLPAACAASAPKPISTAAYVPASPGGGQPVRLPAPPPPSGGGWVRLMEFDTRAGTVHVRTYSTALGKYSNDPTLTDGSMRARFQAPFNYDRNRQLIPEDDPRSSDFRLKVDFGEEMLARFKAKPRTRAKA